MILRSVALFFFLCFLLLPQRAHAEGEATPPPRREHVILSYEGLGVLSDRYGLGVELPLSTRDTLTAYAFFVSGRSTGGDGPNLYSGDSKSFSVKTGAGGLDLQYRRYFSEGSDSAGARGWFIAPGVQAARFVTETSGTETVDHVTCPRDGCSVTRPLARKGQEWTYVGPSFDIGYQAILAPGITMGGSVGGHYRAVLGELDEDYMPLGWRISHGAGLRPRLRLWFGFAF
jgi:hypothetical protein